MKKPIENKLFKVTDQWDRRFVDRLTEDTFWVSNGAYAVKVDLAHVSPERQMIVKSIPVGEMRNIASNTKVEHRVETLIPKEGEKLKTTRALFSSPGDKVLCRKLNGGEVTTYVNDDLRTLIESALGGFDSMDAIDGGSPIAYRRDGEAVALLMPVREDGSE